MRLTRLQKTDLQVRRIVGNDPQRSSYIANMFKVGGKMAVGVPDNVLFEGGAGRDCSKKIWRNVVMCIPCLVYRRVFSMPGES